MPSFDTVNYSLRPSKNIQRQLVFSAVRKLQDHLDLEKMVYVGFGSVWFADFLMAHKQLGVRDMVSIEANAIGFARAKFNVPYATVNVIHGYSTAVLPQLHLDKKMSGRPWFVWLDFDYEANEAAVADMRWLVENAPENSVVLVTFDGKEKKYETLAERPQRLRDVFGPVVPDDLAKEQCRDGQLQETLANFALDFMESVAIDQSRPGGFIPAFRLIYKDTAPMVTVGGILPAKGARQIALQVVDRADWTGRPPKPIVAPHLTPRETVMLQAMLPRSKPLTRAAVRKLGFDLEDDQIEAFQNYYKQYPAFAQVVT